MRPFAKYLLAFIVLVNFESMAQCNLEISGKVIDSEEKLPVSYCFIELDEMGIMATTDSNGTFIISNLCEGTYRLIYYRIGFEPGEHIMSLSQSANLTLQMKFDPSFFKTIEISESTFEVENIQKTQILDKDQLTKQRGQSLGESLERIPGVSTIKTGSTISKPLIHGLHSNRILILNNGIRQEGQQWGNEHAPEVDPFIADRLSVITGAGALRYGHDAIGGVVLVEPSDIRNTPGIGGDLHFTGASNGKMGAMSGNVEFCSAHLPGLSARMQGTLKRSGNIKTPRYYLKNTGTSESNFSLASTYRHEHFNLHVFYSQFNGEVGIFSASHIGNLTDLQNAIHSDIPTETSDFSYDILRPRQVMEHELLKIRLHIFTTEKSKVTLVYARQYNLREEYDKHLPLNDSLAALDLPSLHLEITTHSADINWSLRINNKLQLLAGMTGMYQGNTSEGREFIPNYLRKSAGSFASFQSQFQKTTLESTIRYDFNLLDIYKYENGVFITPSHHYDNYSYALAAGRQLNNYCSVKLTTSRNWRSPQTNELYSNGLHHGAASVEFGDRKLTEEVSWNIFGQINYQSEKLSFDINPFFYIINDFIYLTPVIPATLTVRGAFPTFNYKQADVTMHGCDFSCIATITEQIESRFSASILRAWNQNADTYLTQITPDRYKTEVSYKYHSIGCFEQNQLVFGMQYINRQWRMPAESDYLRSPDAYFLLNAQLSTHIHTKHGIVETSIEINNLLDAQYRDYLNRFRYFADEMGRNITFRIHIPFNKYFSK